MSLTDIKNNLDNLEKRDKSKLIEHIYELLAQERRLDSKIISLRSEIKYLTRHMTKIKNLIIRLLDTRVDNDQTWGDNNDKK